MNKLHTVDSSEDHGDRNSDFDRDRTGAFEDAFMPFISTNQPTPTVDRMLGSFDRQWTKTRDDCLARASELELAAADLRDRAKVINDQLVLTTEVRNLVLYEIEARNRAASLVLVYPPE